MGKDIAILAFFIGIIKANSYSISNCMQAKSNTGPSSAYYSSRSAFCCNEWADAHSLADELFSFISTNTVIHCSSN